MHLCIVRPGSLVTVLTVLLMTIEWACEAPPNPPAGVAYLGCYTDFAAPGYFGRVAVNTYIVSAYM